MKNTYLWKNLKNIFLRLANLLAWGVAGVVMIFSVLSAITFFALGETEPWFLPRIVIVINAYLMAGSLICIVLYFTIKMLLYTNLFPDEKEKIKKREF